MKFLATSTNVGDPGPWIPEESKRMAELAQSGTLEHAYLKADFSGAVLVVEADSLQGATAQLGTLPLVREGVTTFQFTQIVEPSAPV